MIASGQRRTFTDDVIGKVESGITKCLCSLNLASPFSSRTGIKTLNGESKRLAHEFNPAQ
jgi:hypothetical protein